LNSLTGLSVGRSAVLLKGVHPDGALAAPSG
jgi:hypothetical protein